MPPFAALPEAVMLARACESEPRKLSVWVRFPVALGWYFTWNDTLWPATNAWGWLKPITCKFAVDPVTALIVTDEFDVLVIESCKVLLLPTATEPKFRVPLCTDIPPPLLELPERV